MKKSIASLLALFLFVHSVPAFAAEKNDSVLHSEGIAEESNAPVTFIVEVEGEPLAVAGTIEEKSRISQRSEILENQDKVLRGINSKLSENAEKGFVYTRVFNGFTINGTADQLDVIKSVPGVKKAYISKDIAYEKPVSEAELMMDTAGDGTGLGDAYDLQYKGQGTAVAVIDAGLDINHPFFAEAPENPKYTIDDIAAILEADAGINAHVYNATQLYKSAKIPFAYNYLDYNTDTYTSSEHGTHVSGIAVGKNGVLPDGQIFSGAAPEAQLFGMSCGSNDRISEYAYLAALDDAVRFGVDVINMSFGTDYCEQAFETNFKACVDICRDAGITVVAAGGNANRGAGYVPLKSDMIDYNAGGTPGEFASLTTVAASYNNNYKKIGIGLETADGEKHSAAVVNSYESDRFSDAFSNVADGEYLEYVDCGYATASEISELDLTGKLALVKRGEINFDVKADNVKAKGALGMILYNNQSGSILTVKLDLPACVLSLEDGELLAVKTDKRIRYTGIGLVSQSFADAGKITTFSSWGTGSGLHLKPEITAPGGYIYSSVPGGGYDVCSGTSMASPFMAGVSAISSQYYNTNPFADGFNGKTGKEKVLLLENLAMNSANIIRYESGIPYSPRVQGAGLADVNGIINSKVYIEGECGKAKLCLGDNVTDNVTLTFDVTNMSNSEITYDNISIDVITDGYSENSGAAAQYLIADEPVEIPVIAEESVIPEAFSVGAGETKTFTATLKLDSEFTEENLAVFTNGFYVDGYVVMNGTGVETASVPFTGFYGNWSSQKIFDEPLFGKDGKTSYLIDPQSEFALEGKGTFLSMVNYLSSSRFYYRVMGSHKGTLNEIDGERLVYSHKSGMDLVLFGTALRGMGNVDVSIKSENGDEVYKRTLEMNTLKYIPYQLIVPSGDIPELDEGKYTVSYSAKVIGCEDEEADVLAIPFYVDNTYPVFLDAVYDKSAETISLTCADNLFISTMSISYQNPGEEEAKIEYLIESEDCDEDNKVTKVFDVSGIEDLTTVCVHCCDYAGNSTYHNLDFFTEPVGAEIISHNSLNNMNTISFHIRNNTDEDISKDCVIAFYDDGGSMCAADVKELTIGSKEAKETEYNFFGDTSDSTSVKMFIWDIEHLSPFDKAKSFSK